MLEEGIHVHLSYWSLFFWYKVVSEFVEYKLVQYCQKVTFKFPAYSSTNNNVSFEDLTSSWLKKISLASACSAKYERIATDERDWPERCSRATVLETRTPYSKLKNWISWDLSVIPPPPLRSLQRDCWTKFRACQFNYRAHQYSDMQADSHADI